MTTEIPKEYLPVCVRILAESDALFVPARFGTTRAEAIAAIWQRRETFRRTGLPLFAGGAEATRQAHHRELLALQRAGVIRLSGRGKSRGVRLTDDGDAYVRSFTAGFRIDEAWSLLAKVAALAGDRPGPVLEFDIHGDRTNCKSADLVSIEYQALPFLVRGWLESNTDGEGRCGYFITAPGRAALSAGCPAAPVDPPLFDGELADVYDEIYANALHDRERWQPDNRGSIVIPLSCGMWPADPAREPAHA